MMLEAAKYIWISSERASDRNRAPRRAVRASTHPNRCTVHPANTAGRATNAVGVATMPTPLLGPPVGETPRERRREHAVGHRAWWHGLGAAQSPMSCSRGARYLAFSTSRVIGARSQEASKTLAQCSGGRISPGGRRDGARTRSAAAQASRPRLGENHPSPLQRFRAMRDKTFSRGACEHPWVESQASLCDAI